MSGSLAIIGSVLQGTATVVAVQYREDIAGTYWKVLPQWQCDIERIPPEKQGGTERVLLVSVKKGGNGLLPFGEYVASSGLLVLASPCFSKTLVYFQRAHPPN